MALLFALVSGEHFQSFYIFWGSLAFALVYLSLLRAGYDRGAGELMRAAGRQRRAVLVGPRASTSPTWRARCATLRTSRSR